MTAADGQTAWLHGALLNCPALVQTVFYGLVIVVCWTMEQAAMTAGQARKRALAKVNGLIMVCALPVQVAMTALCTVAVAWAAEHRCGLIYQLPWHDNILVRYVAMFVVLDLLDYVYHVAMHHVPVFWQVHLVHHTDDALDASTTVREHPGETFVRNSFLIAWALLCGASLEILLIRRRLRPSRTSSRTRRSPSHQVRRGSWAGYLSRPTCTEFTTIGTARTRTGIMGTSSACGIDALAPSQRSRPGRRKSASTHGGARPQQAASAGRSPSPSGNPPRRAAPARRLPRPARGLNHLLGRLGPPVVGNVDEQLLDHVGGHVISTHHRLDQIVRKQFGNRLVGLAARAGPLLSGWAASQTGHSGSPTGCGPWLRSSMAVS